jgi:hypothetical protein
MVEHLANILGKIASDIYCDLDRQAVLPPVSRHGEALDIELLPAGNGAVGYHVTYSYTTRGAIAAKRVGWAA